MGGHFDILYWVLIVMFYFIPYMLWWLHTNDEEKSGTPGKAGGLIC